MGICRLEPADTVDARRRATRATAGKTGNSPRHAWRRTIAAFTHAATRRSCYRAIPIAPRPCLSPQRSLPGHPTTDGWAGPRNPTRAGSTPGSSASVQDILDPVTSLSCLLPCSPRLERDAPRIDVADVASGVVAEAQLPDTVARLGGKIHRVGRNHVVGAVAAAVVLQ